MKWIALLSLSLAAAGAAEKVVINEIYFDPPDKKPVEFVELLNAGDAPVDVAGWTFEKFTFPPGTMLAPGGYLVLAPDPAAVEKEFGVKALGPLPGHLSSKGETLTLSDAAGLPVEVVKYGAGFPWPTASAGLGSSLERIHPLADGASPGHWRASGYADAVGGKASVFLPAGSPQWRWCKGTVEPSLPRDAWRQMAFAEDKNWQTGKAGFGYGDDDDATVVADMQGRYTSLALRHRVTFPTVPPALLLRLRVDDGCIVWLNGHEIARLRMPGGDAAFDALAQDHEAGDWEEVAVPDAVQFSHPGENILAAQVFNSARDSSDLSFDLSLQTPDGVNRSKRPTPGARNTVAAASAPPACAWVRHTPQQPLEGQLVAITAALTDREGVASAIVQVQVVDPGAYLRKSDPDYEKRWQDFPMHDDGLLGDAQAGDNIWTAQLPAELQQNRRLLRYRIVAADRTGATVRLPYADDPCPNFACYVWNGPTAYAAAVQPGKTPPITFSAEMQRSRPTFTILANAEDVRRSQWDGSYNHRHLPGTLVYEGRVFDHLEFNNRGSASTYVSGKNKWGFHFLHTHELPMRDPWGRLYKRPWNSFALNACSSPWVQINRGMAGLDEAISFRSYQLAGVPASDTIPVGLRVVTTKDEQGPTQFDGDLWGLYLAVEDPDGAWLKNHALPDGLTFKPEDGPKHIPSGFGKDPRAAWEEFNRGPRGEKTEWWRTHMDLPSYYSFHAINALVSNVDLRPGANHAFYQNPERGWAPIPWDLDMQFIPRTHQAGYIDQARCLEIPALALEYKNRVREILDLLASDATPAGGQIGQLVAEYARWIVPAKESWATLDQCRWNQAPQTNDKGSFYRNPASQDMSGGNFKRTLATPDFAGFCKYIVDFCTDSRPQKNYAINDANPTGYGFGRLLRECEDPAIPATPTARYSGPAGFPAAVLTFAASPFSDPQGNQTFSALQWRIAEIAQPANAPWLYEIEPAWQSAELPTQGTDIIVPANICRPGHTYRARARIKDQTNRWSHWSAPVQFTAK